MTIDLALIVGAIAITILLATALVALLNRPRLPNVADAPMTSAPPPGVSPAVAGMIDAGAYPKPALTAAVSNLEHQGYLSIAQPDKDGPFILTRRRTDPPPYADEAALMRELFATGANVTIDATTAANRTLLANVRKAHEAAVRREFGKVHYRTYGGPMFLLLLLAVAACGFVLWSTPSPNYWIGAGLFFAVVFGTSLAFGGSGMPPRRRGPVAAILLLALFVAAPVALVSQLVQPAEPYLMVVAIAVGHGLVGAWLPRPTPEGLKAREAVHGLRSYIEVSTPPPAELVAGREAADTRYRAMRPYAMALGAGPAWSTRHVALLGALGVAAWAATHPHGSTDPSSSDSGWTSSSGGSESAPPREQLHDDMGSAFDSAFDSAFSDAFDSAVSDSTDSGSSDSGGSDGGGGGGDSGGGSSE